MDDGFKFDVAAGVAEELHGRFEKSIAAAKNDMFRAQGAITMCGLGEQRILALQGKVDELGESGEMSADTYQEVKKWVARAAGVMISLQGAAEIKSQTLAGKVLGLEEAREVTAKEHNKHVLRKQAMLRPESEESDEDPARARVGAPARTGGTRPENPIADRKRGSEPDPPVVDEPRIPAPDPKEAVKPKPKPKIDLRRGKGDHSARLQALMKKSKPALKRAAKKAGLSVSGTKASIAKRLADANTG